MQKVNIKKCNLDYDYNRLSTRSKTDLIVVHHTGNPQDDDLSAREINASHQAQGWTCIGYHYVIRKDGTIEEGRPHWTTGAHAYGENSHTIGIHVCGNFEIGKPTSAQIESLAITSSDIESLCLPPVPDAIYTRRWIPWSAKLFSTIIIDEIQNQRYNGHRKSVAIDGNPRLFGIDAPPKVLSR